MGRKPIRKNDTGAAAEALAVTPLPFNAILLINRSEPRRGNTRD